MSDGCSEAGGRPLTEQEIREMGAADLRRRLEYMQSPGKEEEIRDKLKAMIAEAEQVDSDRHLELIRKAARDQYRVQIAAAIAGGAMTKYQVAYGGQETAQPVLTWAEIWSMADDMLVAGGY